MFDSGDLRLVILAMLAEKPRHGYEIIKALGERVGGDYSPSPGVVYPTLSMIEDMGYATAAQEQGGRKLYTLTPEGEAFLAENKAAGRRDLRPPRRRRERAARRLRAGAAGDGEPAHGGAHAHPSPRSARHGYPGDRRRARRRRQGGRAPVRGAAKDATMTPDRMAASIDRYAIWIDSPTRLAASIALPRRVASVFWRTERRPTSVYRPSLTFGPD